MVGLDPDFKDSKQKTSKKGHFYYWCFGCATDLREGNVDHHENWGHRVKSYTDWESLKKDLDQIRAKG